MKDMDDSSACLKNKSTATLSAVMISFLPWVLTNHCIITRELFCMSSLLQLPSLLLLAFAHLGSLQISSSSKNQSPL